MIARPKGRPGRNNGYSIIDAMGLTNRKPKYNLICVSTPILSHVHTVTLLAG